jgi:hypothetical protein
MWRGRGGRGGRGGGRGGRGNYGKRRRESATGDERAGAEEHLSEHDDGKEMGQTATAAKARKGKKISAGSFQTMGRL